MRSVERRGLAFLLGCSVVVVSVPCEGAIEMPGGKPIPGYAKADSRAIEQPWIHWVVSAGYVPKEKWEDAAPANPDASPLPFMSSVVVLAEYQAGVNWLLIGLLDETPANGGPDDSKARLRVRKALGWVPATFVLDSRESLKNPESGIAYKVLFVNDASKEAGDGVKIEPGSVYDAPTATARKRDQRYLYDPYFVYKFVPNTNQPRFMLVGERLSFPITDPALDKLVFGWVDVDRSPVIRWDTRQGVEWTSETTWPDVPAAKRRKHPAEVYGTIAENWAALYPSDAGTGAVESKVLFPERFLAVEKMRQEWIPPGFVDRFRRFQREKGVLISRGFAPHHMRLPVLDTAATSQSTGKASQKESLPRKNEDDGNELLRVGAIGGFGSLSPQEVDDIRKEANRLAGVAANIDILFLVDRTANMDPYFPRVAVAVQQIAEDAVRRAADSKGEVRVAVAMYDDTEGYSTQHDPVEVVFPMTPLTSAAQAAKLADKIRDQKPLEGGEQGEMMFEGLRVASERVGFKEESQKLIVLLSNEGDRSFRGLPDGGLAEETRQLDGLKSVFLAKGSFPVELLAIQVESPHVSKACEAFKRQIDGLKNRGKTWQIEAGRQRGLVTYEVLNKALGPLAEQKQILALVQGRYEALKEDAERFRLDLEKINRIDGFHTEIGPEVQRLMKDRGMSLDEFLKSERPQLFQEGYVWKFPKDLVDRTAQVRVALLLSRAEIKDVVNIISPIADSEEGSDPVDGMKALLEAASGDSKTMYKLSDKILGTLRAGEVPESIVSKLSRLKDKEFDGQPAFVGELRKILDESELRKYQDHILDLSENRSNGKIRHRTLNDYAKVKLGIEFKTELLRLDPRRTIDPRLSIEGLEILKNRRDRLQDILMDVSRDYELTKKTVAGRSVDSWTPGKAYKYRRFFERFPGDTEWCWVREDELP